LSLPESELFQFALETTMTTNRFHSLIAIFLFSVLSSSLAALPAAADSFEPLKETVKFADLDISHPQGVAVLYLRIHAAALNVCSPFDGSRGLSAKMQLDACVKKAVADAVTAIDKPALFAVYSAKIGKTLPARVASLQNR
jgi:UrcA family protein